MKGGPTSRPSLISALCSKPSLCTSYSLAQVLLAIKTPINIPDSETFPSFNPANKLNSLPNLLLPHVSRLLVLLMLLVSSYLPEGLSLSWS
jgi:hypothetical protein